MKKERLQRTAWDFQRRICPVSQLAFSPPRGGDIRRAYMS